MAVGSELALRKVSDYFFWQLQSGFNVEAVSLEDSFIPGSAFQFCGFAPTAALASNVSVCLCSRSVAVQCGWSAWWVAQKVFSRTNLNDLEMTRALRALGDVGLQQERTPKLLRCQVMGLLLLAFGVLGFLVLCTYAVVLAPRPGSPAKLQLEHRSIT